MSGQSQQQHQQHAAAAAAAVAAAGFYPSSGYFTETKPLMPATSTSVYCDQSMTMPPHSDVEQEMADAVAAFSTTSLPPLSQLLPSSKPATQRSSSATTDTNTADVNLTTQPTDSDTTTPSVTTARPSSTIYHQPSPTVRSHPKVPSNHPNMYYRPPPATTGDPYYMASVHGYTSADMTHPPLVFPPSTTSPSTIPMHSPYPQQIRNVPSTRINHQAGSHHLPSPPNSFDHYPMEPQQSQKIFSFVSLPGVSQKKRPRRKYHEVERLYHCNYMGCSKSYGTLNHLNAHVQMQDHGPKRHPSEFKELRKMWRKQKRETQGNKKKNASQTQQTQQQQKQQKSQQTYQQNPVHQHAQSLMSSVQPLIHHPLPPPPPLPTVLYPPQSNHWMAPAPQSNLIHPQQQNQPAVRFPTTTMNYQ